MSRELTARGWHCVLLARNEERLRALASAAPSDQAVAAGRLIERERARQADARASWHGAWRKLERAAR